MRWQLELTSEHPLPVAEHAGSMLRGVLGHGLLHHACRCGTPAHAPDCRYLQLFEPVAPPDWPARYRDCPPPFVITPPREGIGGHRAVFSLTLLGPALAHEALMLDALAHGLATGLGPARTPCRLRTTSRETALSAPTGDSLALRVTSPLLLKRRHAANGRWLTASELTPEDFLLALQRRLDITHQRYGSPAARLLPTTTLPDLAAGLHLQTALQATHYTRRSSRQGRTMPLHGVTGLITLSGHLPDTLRHALRFGEWLHLGGKTALGMGAYQIEESAAHD